VRNQAASWTVGIAVVVGIGAALAACLEHDVRGACPGGGHIDSGGYCVSDDGDLGGRRDLANCSGPGCDAGGVTDDLGAECTDSKMCTAAMPLCASQHCGKCSDSGVCTTYYSGATPPLTLCAPSGACVECLTNDDCAPKNKSCIAATNSCGACVHNSDCATGACTAGACASAGDVYYVDNRAGGSIHSISDCKTANPTVDGTSPAMAFCDVADALAATAKRPYIVVKGSTVAYSAITINSTPAAGVTIIGPGHATPSNAHSPTAHIYTITNSPALTMTLSSGTSSVTVDGMELSGSSGSGNQASGVTCTATGTGVATLKIINSVIDQSGAYGINSSSCAVTLDSDIITQNGGGISITGSTLNATNNIIALNGITGFGVSLIGPVAGTFMFNTVASNTDGNGAGGINCTGTVPQIVASIVFSNSQSGGSSLAGGSCLLSYTDIDETVVGAGGNFNMPPAFAATGLSSLPSPGYRLMSTSPCKDYVAAANVSSPPDHDVDGTARPRASSGKYDCGAAQAP
jgi:hypothetical protein